MSAITRDLMDSTYYTSIYDDKEGILWENVFTNSLNVLGYIPGVSTISGLARIIFASIKLLSIENEDREAVIHYTHHIERGALEALPMVGNNIALAMWDKVTCDYLKSQENKTTVLNVKITLPNVNDTEKWFNL